MTRKSNRAATPQPIVDTTHEPAGEQIGLIQKRISLVEAETDRTQLISGILSALLEAIPAGPRLPTLIELGIRATVQGRGKRTAGEASVVVTVEIHTRDNIGVRTVFGD